MMLSNKIIDDFSPIFGIKALLVADTHNCVNKTEFCDFFSEIPKPDICFFLGDHTDNDIEIVLNELPSDIILAGILGNHDYLLTNHQLPYTDYLSKYHIANLHGKSMEVAGMSITGMGGTYRYTSRQFLSFSQEQSITFSKMLPKADILLSHDGFYNSNRANAHQGLQGIAEYIKKNKPKYFIHGHFHNPYFAKIKHTTEISAYMYQYIML